MKSLKLLLATLALGCAALPSGVAFTVTSLGDSGGRGTLRLGIASSPPGGTIDFAVSGTITLTNGELAIGSNLTILGPGPASLTVSGNESSRVFNIAAGAHVNISNLTISNGYVAGIMSSTGPGGSAVGGGVLNDGTLSLASCRIINNRVAGGDGLGEGGAARGGGVCNRGTLVLVGCTLRGNSAYGGNADTYGRGGDGTGGGLANQGTIALTNCTLNINFTVPGSGGQEPGTSWGGGIWSEGSSASVVNCTISTNTSMKTSEYSHVMGGGLYVSGTLVIMNTIVAGNRARPSSALNSFGPDVFSYGDVLISGYNLIGKTNGSSGWVASDLTGSEDAPLDPLLGPLQDNGGPTPTMALLDGSPAIDNGHSAGYPTDQRGQPRPVDLASYPNAAGGDGSDIGAYEVQYKAIDVGLRAYDGTAVIKLGCEAAAELNSPIRINKNGTSYGIILTPIDSLDASKFRVQTSSGVKALMKLP